MTTGRSLRERLFEPTTLDDQAPIPKIATYAALFLWSLIVLVPLYWVFVTSLKGQGEVQNGPFATAPWLLNEVISTQ
jgi:multiple sugar transport system permease protein